MAVSRQTDANSCSCLLQFFLGPEMSLYSILERIQHKTSVVVPSVNLYGAILRWVYQALDAAGGRVKRLFFWSAVLTPRPSSPPLSPSLYCTFAQDAARDSGRTRARAREGCLCMKGGGGGNKSKGNKKGRGKANPELEAALQDWEPVIGIEIHAQLSSSTKVPTLLLSSSRLQHCWRYAGIKWGRSALPLPAHACGSTMVNKVFIGSQCCSECPLGPPAPYRGCLPQA